MIHLMYNKYLFLLMNYICIWDIIKIITKKKSKSNILSTQLLPKEMDLFYEI